MIISSSLVHTDLHHSAIKPLPFVWPHVQHLPDPHILFDKIFRRRASRRAAEAERKAIEAGVPGTGEKYDHWCYEKHGLKFYFLMLVRFAFEGTEMNMLFERCGFGEWWLRLLWTAAQGALIGIIFGIPCWLLAIIILGPIYRTHNMGNVWAPQAIKGVYGCIVGWITNPIIASLALGSQSEHHLLVVEGEEAEAQIGGVRGDVPPGTSPVIETIVEEEVVEGRPMPNNTPSSPFLRPFRPDSNSSGLAAPSIASQTGSAGRTAGQTLGVPVTPVRTRSGSLSRPPLTANASQLPPPSPQTQATPIRPPQRPVVRARGLSTSAAMSQFSYQLGGTGGRAKRSRSNTTNTLPDIALVQPRKPWTENASPSPGAQNGSPGAISNLELAPPPPFETRERRLSDVAGGVTHATAREQCREDLDLNTSPAPAPDVPQFRIQRPSMEAGAAGLPVTEKDVTDEKR